MAPRIQFSIPAEFILQRCVPTESEINYGFAHEWLNRTEAEKVINALKQDVDHLAAIEEILVPKSPGELSSERDELPITVRQLQETGQWDFAPERLWLFLALSWLYANRNDPEIEIGPNEYLLSDRTQEDFNLWIVSEIYCDFGHPTEIDELIYYMPAPPGETGGHGVLLSKWQNYIARLNETYARRSNLPYFTTVDISELEETGRILTRVLAPIQGWSWRRLLRMGRQ